MDQFDLRILDSIQKFPRASAAELADMVGLSHTPCWRRLKKLEETGAIRGRAVLIDPKALGLGITVYAEIRLKQHDEETLEAFEASVVDRPEILECFLMSGERDYIVRVVVRDVEHYESFLKKVLLHLPGVSAVNSNFALKTVKLTTNLPIANAPERPAPAEVARRNCTAG